MDPDESAFHNAIRANPRHHLPRLAYSDWLEEKGRDEDAAKIRGSLKWLHDPMGKPTDELATGGSLRVPIVHTGVRRHLKDFLHSYLHAALWSSTGDNGEPLDSAYTVGDLEHSTAIKMMRDALRFYHKHRHTIHAFDASDAGHNLWLTQHHHGVGFRDNPAFPREYTDDAHKLGENDVYEGGDGMIHGSRREPVKLAAVRAPAGGAIVNNAFGSGGQFLANPHLPVRSVCRKLREKLKLPSVSPVA